MVNETALNAHWNDVPLIHQNGVILGYRLLLQQEDGGPVVWNITVGPDVRWYMFTDLLIFQSYWIQILALTIKGEGPLSDKVHQMTDESGKWNKLKHLQKPLSLVIWRSSTLASRALHVNRTKRRQKLNREYKIKLNPPILG